MGSVLPSSRERRKLRPTPPPLRSPTYPLSHRLFRLLWLSVWTLLASWTPPPLHAWRRGLVRLFGGKIAPTAEIYASVRIWYPPNVEMGDHSCLGPGVDCYSVARIVLGPGALVSQRAYLCAGTHDISDPNFSLVARPITIGPQAWVAAEAFVGPGVTVGEGAVLGARGVAVRDLQAWSVYGGNPARRLKARSRLSQEDGEPKA